MRENWASVVVLRRLVGDGELQRVSAIWADTLVQWPEGVTILGM